LIQKTFNDQYVVVRIHKNFWTNFFSLHIDEGVIESRLTNLVNILVIAQKVNLAIAEINNAILFENQG